VSGIHLTCSALADFLHLCFGCGCGVVGYKRFFISYQYILYTNCNYREHISSIFIDRSAIFNATRFVTVNF